MRIRGSLFVAMFFLLLGLFGTLQSLTFHYWESIVLPLALSSLIFLMGAVEVCRELRCQDGRETEDDLEAKTRVEMSRLGLTLSWVVGFALGIYLLGFRLAVPLFAFAYLKWRGRSWVAATVFAVVMLAFVYGTFEFGLKALLFKGLIFGGR